MGGLAAAGRAQVALFSVTDIVVVFPFVFYLMKFTDRCKRTGLSKVRCAAHIS